MECIRSQAFLVVRCQTVGLHLYPMSSERFGFVVFARPALFPHSGCFNGRPSTMRTITK